MKKVDLLREIETEVLELTESPLYVYRTENGYQPVVGEGNPDADVMFIGEAPGKQEALNGKPFAGAAGKVLTSLLRHIGLKREDVYITSVIKDRPPNNRNPTKEEIRIYMPFLVRQIDIIQPDIAVLMGKTAIVSVSAAFSVEIHRTVQTVHAWRRTGERPWGKVVLFPTYHPAAVLYMRDIETMLRDDFRKLKKLMSKVNKKKENG